MPDARLQTFESYRIVQYGSAEKKKLAIVSQATRLERRTMQFR